MTSLRRVEEFLDVKHRSYYDVKGQRGRGFVFEYTTLPTPPPGVCETLLQLCIYCVLLLAYEVENFFDLEITLALKPVSIVSRG